MKALPVLLLILLLVLPASALSVGKGSAIGAVKVNVSAAPVVSVAPQRTITVTVAATAPVIPTNARQAVTRVTTSPALSGIPYRTITLVTTTQTISPDLHRTTATASQRGTPVPTPAPGMAELNVFSDPAGANVNIDNTVSLTTNGTTSLAPGNHTLLITKTNYFPYVATVNLAAGTVNDFMATLSTITPLEPTIPSTAVRLTVHILPEGAHVMIGNLNRTEPVTADLQPGTWAVTAAKAGNKSHTMQVTVSGGTWSDLFMFLDPLPPDMTVTNSCLSGQQCLTPDEAAAVYPGQWWYKTSSVCGYATVNNEQVPRYCTQGVSGPGYNLGQSGNPVPVSASGYSLKVHDAMETLALPAAAPSVVPEVQVPGKQGGVVESVFSFFGSLFGR